MDNVDKLLAIEEIKTLKHKYFRAIDMADFDLLEEIFDQDIQVDYRGGTYRWQESGKDAIINALKYSFHNQLEYLDQRSLQVNQNQPYRLL